MGKLRKQQPARLIEIVEAHSYSLMISHLISDFIVKNKSIQAKESLLRKSKEAYGLMLEINAAVTNQFGIEHTPSNGQYIEKLVHYKHK